MQPIPIDLGALPTAFFLAVLVNRLIAYFLTPLVEHQGWNKTFLMYAAALLGFALAMLAEVNLLPLIFPNPLVGRIVTGVIVGGGANLIHDVIGAVGGVTNLTAGRVETGPVHADAVTIESTDKKPAEPSQGADKAE